MLDNSPRAIQPQGLGRHEVRMWIIIGSFVLVLDRSGSVIVDLAIQIPETSNEEVVSSTRYIMAFV